MSDQTITFLILGISVVVFVWNRLPVGIVALGVAVSLWATGVLTLDQSVAGFGNPTVVLIAALFVVAEGLDAAGVTTWAGQLVVNHAGDSRARLLVLIMCAVAILSAMITPNGSVAAMYPMVVVLAVRLGRLPSRLLMPLAFAAHAGALLVLTGSPVSLIVSDAMDEATGEGLGFLEVALVGVPLLAGTILVAIFLGERLLPARESRLMTRDLGLLPQELLSQYVADAALVRLTIEPGSPLVGMHAYRVAIPASYELHLISVQRANGQPLDQEALAVGDVLVGRGELDRLRQYAADQGLAVTAGTTEEPVSCGLVSRDYGVAEVIVTPRSAYVGERVFPGQITESGELVVLAVQRHGEDPQTGELVLHAGDSLLLQGTWEALDRHTTDPNVMVVDTPDAIRRQAAPIGPRAKPALGVLAGMVALLITGLVPAVMVCLLAAIAMVLLGVITVQQAHRSMNWTTLILVAGMIPLSTAIAETGAAETLATGMVDAIGGGGPYLILIGLFLVTLVLGQMISNTATALVLIPIAVSVAVEMDLSPAALLMCVNVAATASLFTPVATPANMMVMEPAGYRFGDYWKFGLPVALVYFVVGVFLVPLIWPL